MNNFVFGRRGFQKKTDVVTQLVEPDYRVEAAWIGWEELI